MMKNKLNLQQILKETSESVNNGHGIKKLEEFKSLLKDLDKEDKKSLKYAIKIIEEVIRLKKKRGGNSLKKIYISILLICLLGLVSGSINYKENGEMFLQGGGGYPLSIKNGINITTGHLYISAGNLHLDGDLIHDQGDVSFSGGTFDVAGEITATKFITPFLQSATGNLKIQANVVGDVILFSSADVDDADDGKELKIWRNAPEGNNYIRTYITSTQNALLHSNTNILFQNAAGKNIQMNSGQHIYLNLGDQAGSDEVRIRDDGGLEVATIDSNGNVWYRGDLSIGVSSDVLIQANGDSYFNGGFVGIGGLIPNSRLSIIGNESGGHTNAAGLAMQNIATGGDTWYLRTGANGTFTPSGGFSIADTSAYRLVIDENGNIGIGTISPISRLHVNGGGAIIEGEFNNWANLTETSFVVQTSGGDAFVAAHNGTDRQKMEFQGNEYEFETGTSPGNYNYFVIDSNGNVGIGTANPGLPLEIRSADDNQAFFFDNRSQAQGVGGGIAFGGKYNDAGGEAMAGRIGVQKTNGISGNVSFDMIFETQDWEGSITERMILTGDGKVGIGEESPTKTLDVGGDVHISGELETDNGIIVSSVASSGDITLGEKITFAFGEIIDNIVNGWIKITGNLEVTGDVNVDSYTLFVDSVDNRVGIGTSDPKEEFHINSTHPTITFEESDASSNEKVWELGATGDEFLIRTANDLHTGMQTIFRLGDRAGTGIGLIEFPQGDVVIGDLSGSGNDYACLDSTGKLFRSNAVC